MRVIEPWNHRPTLELDKLCRGCPELRDLFIRSDGRNASIIEGESLSG
jgi:hypothetical protein